jgi:spermidine synthase
MNVALGNHILVEFMNCDPHIMNDVLSIERDMVGAAQKAGATVIKNMAMLPLIYLLVAR